MCLMNFEPMYLPCGGTAFFDEDQKINNWRCSRCNAVVGSSAQSKDCIEQAKKYELMKVLGGSGWDYNQKE